MLRTLATLLRYVAYVWPPCCDMLRSFGHPVAICCVRLATLLRYVACVWPPCCDMLRAFGHPVAICCVRWPPCCDMLRAFGHPVAICCVRLATLLRYVACVWPPCCDMLRTLATLLRYVAFVWPPCCDMLRAFGHPVAICCVRLATLLRYVAYVGHPVAICCVHLASPFNTCRNIMQHCCVEMLRAFGQALTVKRLCPCFFRCLFNKSISIWTAKIKDEESALDVVKNRKFLGHAKTQTVQTRGKIWRYPLLLRANRKQANLNVI